MTAHIVYNHQCPRCETFYVPYDDDVPCPRCGLVEKQRYDFISEAAESALDNLRTHGSYMPAAWWAGSLGDHILYLVFMALEEYQTGGGGELFAEAAFRVFHNMTWEDQPYLQYHVTNIAIRVHDELQAMTKNVEEQ